MIELFAPKICFAKELKSSWSINLNTESAKIPITQVGNTSCLHFEHTKGEWCTGLIPLTKGWEPTDITSLEYVIFHYYGDTATGCTVSFKDVDDIASPTVNVSKMTPVDDAVCEIKIPMKNFTDRSKKKKKYNPMKAKFIQFSGGPDDNFYISELRIV